MEPIRPLRIGVGGLGIEVGRRRFGSMGEVVRYHERLLLAWTADGSPDTPEALSHFMTPGKAAQPSQGVRHVFAAEHRGKFHLP